MPESPIPLFSDLNLSKPLLRVLQELGYESPSPIQAATIPILQDKRDVIGQAQTGTGKTAAFALPILSNIDLKQSTPQALVLAPTRELAIQVAEAFQRYASYLPGFHVLPIYGGQGYGPQLSALRRGVHVVVGTPGRIMDHLEKNSLDLSQLKTLVLDEADEMLRMGFIDDVETILQRIPATRQTALFSATMPVAIKRIAKTYLRDPAEVTIAAKTGTADNIRQRYWLVSGMHKLEALTRILEVEQFDGLIIFVRTKLGTEELAGKLQARGFAAAAINGDIQQQQRERTIQQLKDGQIDILIATDVAARGLDVERISHVINYDVPYDPESYTHRIGRTGRAGRSGEAILFITPREKNLLKAIERSTRQPVTPMNLPSVQTINDVRIARFKEQIADTLAAGGLETFQSLVEDYEREQNIPALEIAAALAKMVRGNVPLLIDKSVGEMRHGDVRSDDHRGAAQRGERHERGAQVQREASDHRIPIRKERSAHVAAPGTQTYRIAVGHQHGVKPGNIVGAIANEAGMDAKHIGRIEIYDDYSILDLPDDMPVDIVAHLKTVWVAGQQLQISQEHGVTTTRTGEVDGGKRSERSARVEQTERNTETRPRRSEPGTVAGTQSYRIAVGLQHGVKPGNIVGAMINETGMEAKHIGRIEIFDDYSTLDLPDDIQGEVLDQLKNVRVAGQQLKIMRAENTVVVPPASQKVRGQADTARAQRSVTEKSEHVSTKKDERKRKPQSTIEMQTFRIEVGHDHAVTAASIVEVIARESGLDAKHIGRIDIHADHSTLDLPAGMPKPLLHQLKGIELAGQELRISTIGNGTEHHDKRPLPKAGARSGMDKHTSKHDEKGRKGLGRPGANVPGHAGKIRSPRREK